jgi:hypothetical protein
MLSADPRIVAANKVLVREIAYEGKLSDEEEKFLVEMTLESKSKYQTVLPLFEFGLINDSANAPGSFSRRETRQ